MSQHMFTSESVSEGHPDKVADQISDQILDEILSKDKQARVACETLIKSGLVIVAGEIATSAWVDIDKIVREKIKHIGYVGEVIGFDARSCAIVTAISKQSDDISMGVDKQKKKDQGAGDQGLMFGFATNETDVFMPAPITYAHRLMQRQAEARKEKKVDWLRPDAKSQITFRYHKGKPTGIDNIVVSTQHAEHVPLSLVVEFVREEIIKPVIPQGWVDKNTKYHINPTGRFVIGGPLGDCGITGRKIIVDTYGGMARHGGGCFSGKDPSKVDRSGAYMARYVAKNIVAAGLAERCEIQVAYAIGVSKPTSINIETFGSSEYSSDDIKEAVLRVFDFTPWGIVEKLDLLNQQFAPTATYGHFGRQQEGSFSWENLDKVDALKDMMKSKEKKTEKSTQSFQSSMLMAEA
jgi:S-adenosylmethionine synthetase